jgi:HlyD family secretion protein
VKFEDGKAFVEVEGAPQKFERRQVKLGLSDGIDVEVLSGLDARAVLKVQEGGEQGSPLSGGRGRGRR